MSRRSLWIGRSRARGIAALVLVIVLLVLAFGLGLAFSISSTNLAREEQRRLLGEQAALVARNALDEALYAIFTRINSPLESRRYEPDLYVALRQQRSGSALAFELQSLLAWRTAGSGRFTLHPVKVSLLLQIVLEATSFPRRPTKRAA